MGRGLLLAMSVVACSPSARARPPTPHAPSAVAPTAQADPPSDAFTANEREAFEALRRAGRRIALLEPSEVVAGGARLPAAWKDFDAIVLRLEKPTSSDGLLRGISIYWKVKAIDGSMYLVITDEQLYVMSGHDNPHTNHLYWLASVSAAQRAAVKEVLAARTAGSRLDCGRPDVNGRSPHSSSAAEDCFFRAPHGTRLDVGDEHLAETAKNVAALITDLNKALPKDVSALPVPARADLEHRVAVSPMVDEIRSWLGAH